MKHFDQSRIKRKNSLFITLPLYIITIMVISGFFSSIIFNKRMEEKTAEQISEVTSMTLTSLDWSAASLINSQDIKGLQRLIENAASNRFISYMNVCGANGRIIASSSPAEIGKPWKSELVKAVFEKHALIRRKMHSDNTFEAAVPVSGQIFDNLSQSSIQAVIYLKVDKYYADQIYREYSDFFVTQYAFVSVLVTICFLFLISRMVLSPLKKQQNAINSITTGNYDVHLEVLRKDELGRFADTINAMSSEILSNRLELEKTNKNLSEYLKAIDESVIVIRSSLEGKITYANKKFYEITGYTKNEIIGAPVGMIRNYDTDEDTLINYWETILNRFIWREVIEKRAKDGKKFYVNATINPITDTDGEVIEFIDIWYDITQIYELKEELKMHKENLEDIVCLRTKELFDSHQKLKNAYAESEQLNNTLRLTQARMVQQEKLASIGQLAAGVAHELNNPVGFISSNFDVMKRYYDQTFSYVKELENSIAEMEKRCGRKCGNDIQSLFDEMEKSRSNSRVNFIMSDTQDIFKECEHGFARVSGIINSLRDFSRIDIEEKLAPYNLNEGIRSTVTVAKNEIKYVADVNLDLRDLPDILCNGGEINQVLLNLIVNAAHAIEDSGEKKGTIDIATRLDLGFVVCTIRDSGKGIPAEYLGKVFDPFFTTKAPGKGTGLGLSISYDIIVNKHKGMLYAENDGGAKFTIMLPLKSGSVEEKDVQF
ncbi:ATP-binding protein [Seleniivibrio woodruffii]|uniref:ATP-binding protein n=1 Tax=Seleniivibrio woodruffii TaxID=1078050 RepID=UPI00240A0CC3|nr:ATP-binding protein [Seleniivibrio woodruffii]